MPRSRSRATAIATRAGSTLGRATGAISSEPVVIPHRKLPTIVGLLVLGIAGTVLAGRVVANHAAERSVDQSVEVAKAPRTAAPQRTATAAPAPAPAAQPVPQPHPNVAQAAPKQDDEDAADEAKHANLSGEEKPKDVTPALNAMRDAMAHENWQATRNAARIVLDQQPRNREAGKAFSKAECMMHSPPKLRRIIGAFSKKAGNCGM